MTDPRAIAERAARESYGRLLAWLAARTGDIAGAEDALSDAFEAALRTWPETGAPESPDAWLLTAARRKLIDGHRRRTTQRIFEPHLVLIQEERLATDDPMADERLRLMFICAHPAIDASIRAPLILQTVLGLDAERIASAFLTSPAAMSQRLVRAKRKISAARIRFETPSADAFSGRMDAVLDAIYAAFGTGYNDTFGEDRDNALADEALYLSDLVVRLAPQNAEAKGLYALIRYVEARREARLVADPNDPARRVYVPLTAQPVERWRPELLAAAETALGEAARLMSPGRFQLEAAIQSAHMAARLTGEDTRAAVVHLYDRLLAAAPSIGAAIARSAALLNLGDASAAVAALPAVDDPRLAANQSYWATRAALLAATGDPTEALAAYDRAIGLTREGPVRDFLALQRRNLSPGGAE